MNSLEDILTALRRLPAGSKFGLVAGLVLVAAIGAVTWMWGTAPEWRVLFSNVSDRDGGAIVAALGQMNVPYKFSDGGGAILVPAEKVHDARLKLASQGLPKGSIVGFETMENQKFGLTQFQEQVNFQRALEGELARSIMTIDAVQSARVHLAIPKPTVFLREQEKPTASVLVSLLGGRTLDRAQVTGIVHLVSASVPQMNPKNVSVLDQLGNLLSGQQSGIDLDPAQLAYVQQVEAGVIRRIQEILEPIVGRNNVRAQVTADIDFSQGETTSESYKPNQNGEAAVRSQQSSDAGNGPATGAAGIPGTASNQPGGAPPSAAPAGGAASRRDSNVAYEVDRSVRHVRQPVGAIRRLSAAVVVNQKKTVSEDGKTVTFAALPEETMTQINNLVKEAMGYTQQRGDTLNVANAAFTSEPVEAAPEVPIWQKPENIALAKEVGRSLGLGLVFMYLLFGVIRPLFRRVGAAMEEIRAEREVPAGAEALPGPDGSIAAVAAMDPQAARLESVRELARQDPKVVANIVRNWVSKD